MSEEPEFELSEWEQPPLKKFSYYAEILRPNRRETKSP
ncbi:hypothetical protein ES703_113498 [subsurface metagenome]